MVNWGDSRLPDRFWNKVSPCPMSGCWWWTGAADPWGGGVIGRGPRGSGTTSARHFAYEALIGHIPANQRTFPDCGASECCNPLHARTRSLEEQRVRNNRRTTMHAARIDGEGLSYQRRKMHRLDHGWYRDTMAKQGEACAICRRKFSKASLRAQDNIDHDHSTGSVRAILCGYCNVGLGQFKDSPSLLRAAADYLERHAKKQAA